MFGILGSWEGLGSGILDLGACGLVFYGNLGLQVFTDLNASKHYRCFGLWLEYVRCCYARNRGSQLDLPDLISLVVSLLELEHDMETAGIYELC